MLSKENLQNMSAEINWTAYQQGFESWDVWMKDETKERPINPYPNESIEWKSFNKGWNSNDNH